MIEMFGLFGIFLLYFCPAIFFLCVLWDTLKLMLESLFIFMGDEELIAKKKKEMEEY